MIIELPSFLLNQIPKYQLKSHLSLLFLLSNIIIVLFPGVIRGSNFESPGVSTWDLWVWHSCGFAILVGSSIAILSIFCLIRRYKLTLHMMSTCFDLIASYYKELLTTITDLALSLMINYSYYVTAVVEVEQINLLW